MGFVNTRSIPREITVAETFGRFEGSNALRITEMRLLWSKPLRGTTKLSYNRLRLRKVA